MQSKSDTALGGSGDVRQRMQKLVPSGVPSFSVVSSADEWRQLLLKLEGAPKSLVVIVQFSAEWCGPCTKIAPLFKDLSCRFDGLFAKVDVDKAPELADEANATSLPLFAFYRREEGGTSHWKIFDKLLGADAVGLKAKISSLCPRV
eukprot:GHVT01069964.1.p2 GENE.GHVT01069964.1~~GHVT01069964.1.p2  ORF type:complete len:147 (-),score=31.09 GHVT01069964.1:231-671(-)